MVIYRESDPHFSKMLSLSLVHITFQNWKYSPDNIDNKTSLYFTSFDASFCFSEIAAGSSFFLKVLRQNDNLGRTWFCDWYSFISLIYLSIWKGFHNFKYFIQPLHRWVAPILSEQEHMGSKWTKEETSWNYFQFSSYFLFFLAGFAPELIELAGRDSTRLSNNTINAHSFYCTLPDHELWTPKMVSLN